MANEIKEYKEIDLTPAQIEEVAKIKDTINISDSNGIISFGAQAQRKSSDFIDSVLSTVKTKELNETGILLNNLMADIQKFDANSSESKNFLAKLFSNTESRIQKIRGSYKSIEQNIGTVVDTLEKNRLQLMQSNAMLDKLYEKSVDYVNEIKLYIIAGERKAIEINNELIPRLQTQLMETNDQILAQTVRDTTDALNRLEKKVHDLKLTRTVYLQTLPQIRLQQSSNNVLIDKIHSSIVNAIPLWKSQMVIALGLAHTSNALKAQKAVSDTTNELLRRNSEMLKTSTVEAAKENERAIVDLETIRKANTDIISTIKQVVSIQQEGRIKRKEAEEELKRLETELKENLITAIGSK